MPPQPSKQNPCREGPSREARAPEPPGRAKSPSTAQQESATVVGDEDALTLPAAASEAPRVTEYSNAGEAIGPFYHASGGSDNMWINDFGWSEVDAVRSTSCTFVLPHGVGCAFVPTDRTGLEPTSLELQGNGLIGDSSDLSFPLRGLVSSGGLLRLNLSFNQIGGRLAELLPWNCLANVEFLSLSGNCLMGELPEDIGMLTSLEELWISANQLMGQLPSAIGPLTLPRLRVVAMSDNLLRGCLTVLFGGSGLSPLQRLDAANNGFEDSAWKSLAAAGHSRRLPSLTSLDVSGNSFVERETSALYRTLLDSVPSLAALRV